MHQSMERWWLRVCQRYIKGWNDGGWGGAFVLTMVLAMIDDVSFGLVDEATSSTYPEGDARTALGKLIQRYESQTNALRVKLMGQFTSSKLRKSTQDPDSWISELELMRIRLKKMGSSIDDEYLMMHIMNNLPSAYDGLIGRPFDD